MNIDALTGRGAGLPRRLTPLEYQLIRAILTDDCPSGSDLKAQLASARVSGHWEPTGSPSIDLEADIDSPAAHLSDGVLPIDAHVYDANDNYVGELIIWISDGRLSALEYAWVTDEMPQALPPVDSLRISPRQV